MCRTECRKHKSVRWLDQFLAGSLDTMGLDIRVNTAIPPQA
jgi:hypothetical protein